MTFVLGSLSSQVVATARPDGWWLSPTAGATCDLTRRATWPAAALAEPDGVSIALQTELLLDLELAEPRDGAVVVPWDRFGEVMKEDIRVPFRWTSWSPLMLSIDRVGDLGRQDFRYDYRYRFGARETGVERIGFFIRRSSTNQMFHLDEQTFVLVDAMDRFNDLPPTERSVESAWLTFSTVKGCSTAVGAGLDAHLASNDVIVPSQIALDIFVHEDDSISFVPKVEGVPDKELREAFLRNADAQGLYTLDGAGGRRVRVVLSERHKQVLDRMKQVRRAGGSARVEAENHPAQFFEGLLDAVEIRYGPRVIGIGDFPFASVPAGKSDGGGFFDDLQPPDEKSGTTEQPSARDRPTTITAVGPDGGDVRLCMKNGGAVAEARSAIASAIEAGLATVFIQGREIVATNELLQALAAPAVETKDGTERAGGRKFLLVYTNEEDLRATDAEAAARASRIPRQWLTEPRFPRALRPDVKLKQHQIDSLLWLQRCSAIEDRRGVLLADDMGLGKTLQILTFLAGRIEAGHLNWTADSADDGPPWRPILIVAPLILVENETWLSEIRAFFANEGDAFQPTLVLHGQGIDAVREDRTRGGETMVGKPLLSAETLMQYRTVITNYETVVNYQHSLAQLKKGRPLWSMVVTDEAQKYKGMKTKVSMALKAVPGDFHIASTGTPVENRLLDLWNIVDTIQPALLGPAAEFAVNYEHRLGSDGERAAMGELRHRLLFGEPHAFIIRRSKEDVLDLPTKKTEILSCEMSDAERAAHAELLAALSRERPLGRHLAVLHRLTQLYQHPALLRGDWDRRQVGELISTSGKLKAVIAQLHRIRSRSEKVLIFARHHDVQQLLARVIGAEFGLAVPIINGGTSRGKGLNSSSAGSGRAKNERKHILDGFRTAPGFAAIVLSPFVAGIGLTITEANHVVHYGRWWNPAVEAQATDRAYRIGQTREVTVYLPILRDQTGQIGRSFDECLQQLLERKAALAKDFLHPTDDEAQNVSELCSMLGQDGDDAPTDGGTPFTASDLDGLDPADFEAVVAALYRARGYRVVLTAKGGDGGADVLALKSDEATLVQTKHSFSRSPVDERALNDVIAACDVYAHRLNVRWKGVIVSNSPMSAETIREAQHCGVELVPGDKLARFVADAKIGFGATAACAAARCTSFDDGVQQAAAFLAT